MLVKKIKVEIKTQVKTQVIITGCCVVSAVTVSAIPWHFSEFCLFVYSHSLSEEVKNSFLHTRS